jgi:hypothetical protein
MAAATGMDMVGAIHHRDGVRGPISSHTGENTPRAGNVVWIGGTIAMTDAMIVEMIVMIGGTIGRRE